MNNEELSLTLRYINTVRERCDLTPLTEIPKGVAPDSANEISRSCPLARAIPNTVIALEYARTPDHRTAEALSQSFGAPPQTLIEFPGEFVIDLPEALLDFVASYDDGRLPQFIEES
jgi:hypothetical protein